MRINRLAPIALVLLAACGQADLYTNVSEKEANEMIVTLAEAGVDAKKKPGAEGAFTVAASGADFEFAMQVLTAADFPRDQNDTMRAILTKKGLVSSDAEQRLRANSLLTENINATLSAIDGVQVARVHVVSPAKSRLGQSDSQPTASVFIKHDPDTDLASEVGKVKALVANAVEDLSYENVSVALFPAARAPIRQEPPVEQAAAEMALPVLGGLGVLAMALASLRAARRSKAGARKEIEGPAEATDD